MPFRIRFRGVEAGLRTLLVSWAKRLNRRAQRAAPLAEAGDAPRRVLYLRYDRIGDMILATGLLRALAQADPPIAVDVLASPENATVLEGNPNVRSIILFERRRPLRIIRAFQRVRRAQYDAVLDCQVFSPSTTTLLMMLLSGARRRVGVANRGIDDALTDPVPVPPGAAHTIEHTAALAGAFGIDPLTTDWRPELYLRSDELTAAEAQWRAVDAHVEGESADGGHRTRLLVNISAGKAACRWPEASVTSLLAQLAHREPAPTLLLVCAPSDLATASRISAATGVRVARTPRVRDALALVAASDVVLTPDTSITHAASALNKPAVVLLPRGRDRHWGPYRTAGRAIASPGRRVDELPVPPVYAALDTALGTVEATVLEHRSAAP
jgi:ADP-heptose:LPS heptosyltransferase